MASQKTIRKIISSPLCPKPVGPYNGGTVAETRQALLNMGHILKEAGSNYNKVIKTTIFLQDINDFTDVNEVYKEFFKENYPARSTFQVGKLPMAAQLEIEAIAITGEVETI
ncbi:2-iminobutanoate/2-iminopropanoate deaminase isoform X2 [Apis laboriosa]|uniref:2-iminobutanoate/2-iminopropanoate deaminase isoform X2 n=1 Tax=Apis laboriosa TaxID=183418 RepID=UPI001CC6BB76|nr:2-iminobutanoate/2-iminopropanoate deaminase isoform X2 [Apis laboriosa]